jgi:hypothetical protein
MGGYQHTCVSFFVTQANNFDILAGVSGQLTTFFLNANPFALI